MGAEMKIEPKCCPQKNRLHFYEKDETPSEETLYIEGTSCTASSADSAGEHRLFAVLVRWTDTGTDEDSYNEAFLAGLRSWLKSLEEKRSFAFIVPVADKVPSSDAEKERFIASFSHCARRIKDCAHVIGFAVPEEADPMLFMQELSAKHSHYIFFSRNEKLIESDETVVRIR